MRAGRAVEHGEVGVDRTERLSVESVDGVGATTATIVVVGELDAYTVGDLEQRLELSGTDADVRVDLSGVTFMDSSGIRALVRADNALRAADRTLIVAAPSSPVLRLFELTSLVDRFHIDPAAP